MYLFFLGGENSFQKSIVLKYVHVKSRLTYSHHVEFYLLLHSDLFITQRQVKGTVNGAAVRPNVIVCDVVNVNGRCLDITVWCATPL